MTTISGAGAHASAAKTDRVPASKDGNKGYLTLAQMNTLIGVPRTGSAETITDLLGVDAAANVADGEKYFVFGRSALGDTTPFVVEWSASSATAHDGFVVFRPTTGAASTGNGRWIRVAVSSVQAFADSDATPSIANGNYFTGPATPPAAITDFDNAHEQQIFTVARGAADVTITHDDTKIDCGGEDVILTAENPRATFFHVGGIHRLIGRGGVTATPGASGAGEIVVTDEDYGLKADLVNRTTGVATSGDATFTDSGAAFTADDVGKAFYAAGAGTAGATLATTILSINSSTSIELAAAPSTSVASNCHYAYFTPNDTAFDAVLSTVTAEARPRSIVFSSGRYGFTAAKTIAKTGLQIIGRGDVQIFNFSSGDMFYLDGGASGYIWGVELRNITFIGLPTSGGSLKLRSCHRSKFKGVRVLGSGTAATAAIETQFGVLNSWDDCCISNNELGTAAYWAWGATVAKPAQGFLTTRRGSGSDKSGHNVMKNLIVEGVFGASVKDDHSIGSTYFGGAWEGATDATAGKGYVNTADTFGARLSGVDWEANASNIDAECAGINCEFHAIQSYKELKFTSGALYNLITGGDYLTISFAAGANYNRVRDSRVNRAPGGGGILDSGTGNVFDAWDISNVRRLTNMRFNRGHLAGLECANNSGDLSNDWDIGAGECRDRASTYDMVLSAALTGKQTDVAWAAGSAAGALDAGTIADGSYHGHLIAKPDGTTDFIVSLSHDTKLTATMTIASPGVVTCTDHGLQVNSPFKFETTGALPTGVTAGTQYYVTTVVDANSFRFSATRGGSDVNTSGSQSGVHTMVPGPVLPTGYTKFRRLFSFTRISGVNRRMIQRGDEFIFVQFEFGGAINGPSKGSRQSLTLTGMPKGVRAMVQMSASIKDVSPNDDSYFCLYSLDQADFAPSAAQSDIALWANSGVVTNMTASGNCIKRVPSNRSSQIAWRIETAAAAMTDHTIYGYMSGFRDTRGRFAE